MSLNPQNPPRVAAIEQLQNFGLSTYAAETYVTLYEIGSSTAQQISDNSDVPRTRVYDAIEELEGCGLVDVQQSSPKRFWAVSGGTACQYYERQFTRRLNILRESLAGIEQVTPKEEQRGVWTVTGEDRITDRIIEFIDEADTELVFMSVEILLSDEILDALADAYDRDVMIKLGKMEAAVREEIEATVPTLEYVECLWEWSDSPAGRLLLVDGDRTLASVLDEKAVERSARTGMETAIWGTGATNSLVTVLRAIFDWQPSSRNDS